MVMEVSLINGGKVESVFGVYSVQGKSYFCCSPDGYGGLLVLSESEVNSDGVGVPGYFIDIADGFYHPAVGDRSRLAGLLECDPESYFEFRRALAEMGKHA